MLGSKESSDGPEQNSGDNTFIAKLQEHIKSNLNNDQFGVDNLAQAVGMSRSSLHRKLRKYLSISTSQFIREYRLKRAFEILLKEGITASEAAYRVGFSSATYFSTSFHKFYGFTPGEVKSGNSIGVEQIVSDFRTTTVKNRPKKRTLWLVVAGLATLIFLTAIFLFLSRNHNNSKLRDFEKTWGARSIVVLPLKNLTGNRDLEYVSDGMTDAVISGLAKISAFDKIIPFTSVLQYKETKKTIKEIATEVGVANLLQGNLQISGDRIKINLQLFNPGFDTLLWSEEYIRDWKSDEIFKMQTEVVEDIATNLNALITERELANIRKIPTKSKQAYSYYLQAEFQRNKANEKTYSNAIALYEKAIAIDSNFVEAYVSMANIWSFGGLVWGIYNEQLAWSNAKRLLQKAYEIDPTNQEVEEELYTGYFYYDWNFKVVEEYYQYILNNSFYDKTPAINFDYAIKTGRFKDAIKTIEEHILIDPSIGNFFFFKAEALMFLGRNDEAIEVLTISDPLYNDNWFYLRESAKLYFYLGEYEKSKTQLTKLLTKFPDYPPILMWLNAVHSQLDGNSKDADKYLAELHDKYEEDASGSPAWFIGLYYCTLKDYEKALEWLQRSFDSQEVEMTWLREEPLLAPIRDGSRYKDLYDKVGFSQIGLPILSTSKNQFP